MGTAYYYSGAGYCYVTQSGFELKSSDVLSLLSIWDMCELHTWYTFLTMFMANL